MTRSVDVQRLCSACMLLSLVLVGCSDDAAEDPATDAAGGSTGSESVETSSADGSSSDGAEAPGDGTISGRLLWLDGTETVLDLDARFDAVEFDGVAQYNCGGSDVAAGFTLAVLWYAGTDVGGHPVSFADGPSIIAAWPHVDGSGIRATTPAEGEVTFDRIGVEPGDVIEGTASAVLTPGKDNPDDRVREIVDIAFRCVVP